LINCQFILTKILITINRFPIFHLLLTSVHERLI